MEPTNRQLVIRAQEGDRDAFSDLVERYRDMVYGLGYHLTRDFESARDLAQEAFVQAYLKLGQLRDPDRFSGWLRQITANAHRNLRRRQQVATVALEDVPDLAGTRRQSEIEIVVREALSKLRGPERLALTLHYINGYSHAEIGDFLGVRSETIKTRLARARQHLREEVIAMVEDTFERKKLSDDFTAETVKGLDLHRGFFNDCAKPLLMQAFPEEFPLLAVASVGFGSDRLGADDEVSRDHCWEPGLQLFSAQLSRETLKSIESYLFEHLPWEYAGFTRGDSLGSPNGIRAWTVDEFFSSMTSFALPPAQDRQWLLISDVALYHATNGEVFHDPTGDFTRRREAFGYYPDNVWRFKVAGRTFRIQLARLEMERCMAHGEDVAADLMLHEGLREVFHFICLVNKRYACIDKWLPWFVRRMPVLADPVGSLIARIRETTDMGIRLARFAEIVTMLADYVYESGLATRGEYWWTSLPGRNPWWVDLRQAVTGDLKDLTENQAWIGVEDRYASSSGSEFRKLLAANG